MRRRRTFPVRHPLVPSGRDPAPALRSAPGGEPGQVGAGPERVRPRALALALVLLAVLVCGTGAAPVRALTGEPGYPSATVTDWQPPVPGEVVRTAELPARPWLPGHRGLDLAAAAGDSVVAPRAGTVTFTGMVAGRAVVVVSHGELRSTLEPVGAVVDVGTMVGPGERVGTVAAGGSHCAPLSCLHWGVRRGDQYLDPATLLGRAEPIVLLPAG
jgi:murein DD-endopeptidase MepM/ murein hydrolase activator NlpD